MIDNTHLPIDMVIVPEEIVDSDQSRDSAGDNELNDNVSELDTPEWKKRKQQE